MNRITEFVDSFIPKNLPKKRKAALKDELENHIFDKRDFYKEIGFTEEQSVEKAIKDFGTDEEMKKHIFSEFEELYSERTIWGIFSFIFILLMNWSCLLLNVWVTSADFNKDPEPLGTFISFMMILAVIALIIFARIKKYRKMLISIGLANLPVAGVYFFCFYPQMAAYSIGYNFLYFMDRFTPIYTSDLSAYGIDGILIAVIMFGFPVAFALYSFIESVRIKKGRAKSVGKPIKKTVIFSAVYFTVTAVSCLILPVAMDYFDEYPVWFEEYNIRISEESENIYDEIGIGDEISDIEAFLYSNGYQPIEKYRNSLDRLGKKQFDDNLRHFDFIDGYTIWFSPDRYIKGNGFIGIKAENGTVTGVGMGNLNKEVYYEAQYDDKNFGISSGLPNDDMKEILDCFEGLNKGDSLNDVMSLFGKEFGELYTERISLENGTVKHYYRIYCRGDTISNDYWEFDYYYIELQFSDFMLEKGVLYSKIHNIDDTVVEKTYVK